MRWVQTIAEAVVDIAEVVVVESVPGRDPCLGPCPGPVGRCIGLDTVLLVMDVTLWSLSHDIVFVATAVVVVVVGGE